MCTFADMLVIIIDFALLLQRVCDCFCWSFVFPIFLSGLTHLPTTLRHPSSSPSSLPWERWPICQCPACRQEACCGLQTWRHQILFIFCLWPSLERCFSSWRWSQISYSQKKHGNKKRVMVKNYWPTSSPSFFLSWVQSLGLTTPTCEPWRRCSGSCL